MDRDIYNSFRDLYHMIYEGSAKDINRRVQKRWTQSIKNSIQRGQKESQAQKEFQAQRSRDVQAEREARKQAKTDEMMGNKIRKMKLPPIRD